MITFSYTEYSAFDKAYEHFNARLFNNELPACFITLQRKRGAYGYFCPDEFKSRDGGMTTHEIAMNPAAFAGRTDRDICSTLAHEMVHLWQQEFGKPSRSGYHNMQWAEKMQEIGLQPISYDKPGKMTGQRVSHEIVEGGAYDRAYDELETEGFKLLWESADHLHAAASKKSKVKYSCPGCQQNAWAKPGAKLMCGDCEVHMVSEDSDDDGGEGV